jgi:hypothetical protein
MPKKAGIRNQERDKEYQHKRRCPSRDLGVTKHEMRIRFVCLDSLHRKQSEHPYAAVTC